MKWWGYVGLGFLIARYGSPFIDDPFFWLWLIFLIFVAFEMIKSVWTRHD